VTVIWIVEPRMEKLDLALNVSGRAGVEVLAGALRNHPTLTFLALTGQGTEGRRRGERHVSGRIIGKRMQHARRTEGSDVLL
jgi:hypothetical protein